jgi:glutathione S-transferase
MKPYVPEPFVREGFIHTTEGREAVSITLTKYYKSSAEPWVVLYIDLDRVTSPIRYDDPAEVFPHIYGRLNREAIVAVKDIGRASDGTFLKPAML